MRLTRRGAGLAELLVAMALTSLIAAIALGGVVRLQRTVARHAERLSMEAGLRGAAQLIRSELRDAGVGASGDLLAIGPAGMTYRAVRGTGSSCGQDATALLVEAGSFRALRMPVPGRDSVLVLAGSPASTDSLRWIVLPLLGPPATARCSGGATAQALPVPLAGLPAIANGTPVRVVEPMELRLYQSGGSWWLGLRSLGTGEAIQPAFGPFADAVLAFRFHDQVGTETLLAAAATSVSVVLRGVTSVEQGAGGAASAGAGGRDSMIVTLPLRNAP